MKLLDVNILVQAHREDADQHSAIFIWLNNALTQSYGLAVPDLVLSGTLRIITHPKIFKNPTPRYRAIGFLEDFRGRENVHILAPGTHHWQIFLELCQKGDARGNQIPDAYHAALAIEHDCDWISLDRGFARYPGLKFRSPLE